MSLRQAVRERDDEGMQTMPATTSVPPQQASHAGPAAIADRVRARWSGMAGRLGLGFSLLGFFVIVLAWNGAAALDYAQGQLPYLLSGGFGGLGLIVTGAALTVAESHRRDRAILERQLRELTATISRMNAAPVQSNGYSNGAAGGQAAHNAYAPDADLVVAGRSSFHRPECRLVSGRNDGVLMTIDDAESDGLAPCRVCKP